MKITILNGSPKGDESVTMQYILYIEKKIPEHDYKIINIAQQIKKIEKNEQAFQEILEEINASNGIIWGFPVFVMLIPSQLKRFIELIFERNAENVFKNKYTAALSTSIHFYDHTAQNYLQAICDDLNMKYVGNFPADSWDLLFPKKRPKLLLFSENFFKHIEEGLATSKHFSPLNFREFEYNPSEIGDNKNKINVNGKKVLVVSDSTDKKTNLGKMIWRFKESFSDEIEVINIHDIDIKRGCISCLKCTYDHQCIYKEKDGFFDFWENKVIKADVLIFAGIIKDRFLSARWKMIYDRLFYMNHTPTLINKQIGHIISGPLSQIPNLKEVLQAQTEYQDSNFVDIITDEFGSSAEIDSLLQDFAKKLISFSNSNYIKPPTFLGEGAKKVFRDDIYGRNRFAFLADHEYFESHGLYDTFPQRDERAKKMNEKLIPLLKIEKVRKKMNFKKEFLRPFKKVIADPNK
ncbi:MAG: NAD(P)H-dependent oxidoreductase [Promethearchaeota archaeon]